MMDSSSNNAGTTVLGSNGLERKMNGQAILNAIRQLQKENTLSAGDIKRFLSTEFNLDGPQAGIFLKKAFNRNILRELGADLKVSENKGRSKSGGKGKKRKKSGGGKKGKGGKKGGKGKGRKKSKKADDEDEK